VGDTQASTSSGSRIPGGGRSSRRSRRRKVRRGASMSHVPVPGPSVPPGGAAGASSTRGGTSSAPGNTGSREVVRHVGGSRNWVNTRSLMRLREAAEGRRQARRPRDGSSRSGRWSTERHELERSRGAAPRGRPPCSASRGSGCRPARYERAHPGPSPGPFLDLLGETHERGRLGRNTSGQARARPAAPAAGRHAPARGPPPRRAKFAWPGGGECETFAPALACRDSRSSTFKTSTSQPR